MGFKGLENFFFFNLKLIETTIRPLSYYLHESYFFLAAIWTPSALRVFVDRALQRVS